MKQDEFTRQVEYHTDDLKAYEAVSNRVGYVKLVMVMLLGVLIYFLFAWGFPVVLVIVGVVGFVGLIFLWVYHHKIHEKLSRAKGLIAINKRHLARILGEWTAFIDTGAEFACREHPYSSDLDIVGGKSLFQFLNTTHTWHGRQAFARALLEPGFSEDEIVHRQEAIRELSQDIEFSTSMEYSFSKIGSHNAADKLVAELGDGSVFTESRVGKYLLMYMPLLTLTIIAGAMIFGHISLLIGAICAVALQGLAWLIGMGTAHRYVGAVSSRLPYKLGAYTQVIDILQVKNFDSIKIQEIQDKLRATDVSAKEAIVALGKIVDRVNIRHNALIWFGVNVLLLWDFWCAISFEKWKLKYAHRVEGWFTALGEFEGLLSFSNFPNVCGNTSLPVIVREKAIRASKLGHPLISNATRVNNDFVCDDNIFILSGSNMSGKTTFMRTVGINLVLARAGSFVCAREMSFALVEIMTSMRVADDLNEGISTFYAELKRIKAIIEFSKKEPRMLFLIDEIFRGTNSVDRLSGAKTVLAKLDNLGAIGVITTHDLELCEIAAFYPRIENYSFSEEYRDGQICFDYVIRDGKSTSTNAKYLMEMVGITHG